MSGDVLSGNAGKGTVEGSVRPQRRKGTGQRGQSLVELALLMPFVGLMLIGALDLGRAFHEYTQLTNSVQAGAFYGQFLPNAVTDSDSPNPRNIVFKVQDEGRLTIAASDITVRCYQGPSIGSTTLRGNGTCSLASGVQSGDIIEVTALRPFTSITAQLSAVLPTTYKMQKSVRMVIR